jgi:hypothetical protein
MSKYLQMLDLAVWGLLLGVGMISFMQGKYFEGLVMLSLLMVMAKINSLYYKSKK